MGIGRPLRRAVFLDRDGVLNRAVVREGRPYPPVSLDGMEVLPKVPEAATALKQAGFLLVMVTNQPDVARGKTERTTVDAMNTHLSGLLGLDAVLCCFHDESDGCRCRKPKPGMLQDAARAFGIDLSASYMVGDRWRDTEAGRRAGCATFFIDYGYREAQPESCDYRVSSLWEASRIIIEEGER
jgi:D-glycero-D-manno-heptose 1,7-bisphosphate phosphatase